MPGDIPLETAEATYLECTNRWLDAFRLHCKRHKCKWSYASVTERQKRGHPHSHYLTTARPADTFNAFDEYDRYSASVANINRQIDLDQRFSPTKRATLRYTDLHSEWLMLAADSAGLGIQARISDVDTVEGASRYVAKYLFKSSMFTTFPKGWRRVRYSNNFPDYETSEAHVGFPLTTAAAWQRAADLSQDLICYSAYAYDQAQAHGLDNALLMDRPLSQIHDHIVQPVADEL